MANKIARDMAPGSFRPPPSRILDGSPPEVRGKYVYAGGEKIYVRGVTYGTFGANGAGEAVPEPERVVSDLARMASCSVTAVRTYAVPPRWFLDAAHLQGLRVMVGIPWEQHVAFLEDTRLTRSIEDRVRGAVQACAGHPAVLSFAIGNEIPASVVRWHGKGRVERFLERLFRAAKAEDPEALVTYVNYPTTEYLDLSFLDLVCFNVYLEDPGRFESYVSRLHNLAGERPLMLTEIGLDSRRNGEAAQAGFIATQVRTAFELGCAGAFVFAWTDEWHRDGREVEDWDFGITRRDRSAKPALGALARAWSQVPFSDGREWPSVTVVVCTYNGARTIRDCLAGLQALDYPAFEVIVVDDGSTDGTAVIIDEYGFRRISTENRGLSRARNTGIAAATGDIVAFIDDDAYPDPHWLRYLAATFTRTQHAGVGGPNLIPPEDGPIAQCVANAPGGPAHVLLSDTEAEHIPGVNCAYRTEALRAIGGFDPQFRAAGDDVDVCWRLQRAGWTLGFAAGAVNWHHRRNSIRAYWRQQQGYGLAEALLERKWPEKYNGLGHLTWSGRIYGKGLTLPLPWGRARVYQGGGGLAPYQSLYGPPLTALGALPLTPEWYLLVALLGLFSSLGLAWAPMALATPLFLIAALAPAIQAALSARRALHPTKPMSRLAVNRMIVITFTLHLAQPLARLSGRLKHGLSPWRHRGAATWGWPYPRAFSMWNEQWQAPAELHQRLITAVRDLGYVAPPGGEWDSWDLEVRGGLLGQVRVRVAVEEHGRGRQLVRLRAWPVVSPGVWALLGLFGALAAGAAIGNAREAAALLGIVAVYLCWGLWLELGRAFGAVRVATEAVAGGIGASFIRRP